MSEQDRKPVKATEGKATDDAPANKPSQEVLDLLQEARRREKVGSAPLQWGQVLETLFDRVPVATSYREIVPVLRGLADREPQSTLTATIDDEGGAFEIGATLDLQIQSARGYLSEDTGPKGVFAINLLLEAIVRCAKLSDEMGRSAPQFQGAKLSPERLYMLAQEIAVFSLVPSGDIEALLRRLSVKERVSILPGPDDTGISLADIRRRQTKGGWTEPLIEPFAQNVALVLPDDPWQPGLKDRSGAEREVAAFASMFTARDFNPPLAVGVFGDWGSGKSFFIRLLHEAVEQSAAGGGKDRETLEHVVQIHFNAWHYAETNLWASIVDRIFTELDGWSQQNNADSQSRKPSIVEQLATSRRLAFDALENLIAARRLKNEAKQALDDATQAYADKKEEGGSA